MKKTLLVSLVGLIGALGNSWALDNTNVSPAAVERALSSLFVEDTDKSVSEFFDADKFVDLIVRKYPTEHIELGALGPACRRVVDAEKLRIRAVDRVRDTVLSDSETDIVGFCSELVNNIIRHHNAIVGERRAEFYYSILPSEKLKTTDDGGYYLAKIDVSHIEFGDVTDEVQHRRLSNMRAVFNSSDDSVVCVMPRYPWVCKSAADGLLFESDNYDLYIYNREMSESKPYRLETYNSAPVGLSVLYDTVNASLGTIKQDGTDTAQVASGLY